MITKTELLLAVMSGYIAEVMSDIIQVIHFRRTGSASSAWPRYTTTSSFRGWRNPRSLRFWVASAFFAALGLAGL